MASALDLQALEKHLTTIGWSMSRLQSIIDVTPDTKSSVWHLIRPDAIAVRMAVTKVRLWFPEARVEKISL
jgi:hypothetical protein